MKHTIVRTILLLGFFLMIPSVSFANTNNVSLFNKPDLILATEADYPPFLYFQNGKVEGISYDYSVLLTQKLGKNLLTSEPLQLQDMLDRVKNGSLDILADITKTPERDVYLEFSQPYLEVPAVVITNARNPSHNWKDPRFSVGVGKGYGVVSYLQSEYPSVTLSEFPSDSKIIEAVAAGNIEFGVLDIGSLSYFLKKTPTINVEVIDELDFHYSLSFAVSEANKEYIPVINSVISNLSPEERNNIYSHWISAAPSSNRTFFEKNRTLILGTSAALLLILFIWAITLQSALIKKNKLLANIKHSLEEYARKKKASDTQSTLETDKHVIDLERTKQATINLLEDLQLEKKKIAESEARNKAMLESIGEGLIAIDMQGKVIFVNAVFEKMFGLHEKDIVGKVFATVVPAFDKEKKPIPLANRIITKILHSNTSFSTTPGSHFFYQHPDKTFFPASVVISPINVGNEQIGVIEAIKDISQELEVDKAKTEFVSLASHQLRTPLSSINWYTEMLLAGDAGVISEDQKKYLGEVYQASKRMVTLVNSLLNVSRLELGTFIIEPAPTNVHEILVSVFDELTPQITTKNLSVIYDRTTTIPTIPLDQKLFRIVIQNILSNAVKYTPNNGKVAAIVASDTSTITITISDTGYGIPENQKDKIFQKLFRADNVRQKETEGTGLGLYLAKSILDSSGGKIWFDSVENKGTTFYIQIPLSGMKKKEGTKSLS